VLFRWLLVVRGCGGLWFVSVEAGGSGLWLLVVRGCGGWWFGAVAAVVRGCGCWWFVSMAAGGSFRRGPCYREPMG